MKRLIWVVGFIAAFAVPVIAQQAAAPTSAPLPSEYNLKVGAPDIDVIGKALGKLPYEEVAQLMQKLREQVYTQQQAVKPKAEGQK